MVEKSFVFSRAASNLSKCRQIGSDQLTNSGPLLTVASDTEESKSTETIQKSIRERCPKESLYQECL